MTTTGERASRAGSVICSSWNASPQSAAKPRTRSSSRSGRMRRSTVPWRSSAAMPHSISYCHDRWWYGPAVKPTWAIEWSPGCAGRWPRSWPATRHHVRTPEPCSSVLAELECRYGASATTAPSPVSGSLVTSPPRSSTAR
ncbi:hypothetical protein GCM10009559_66530 [Pseudonocardia zijingensis]|uniref:Uncharacterized protein n=1 Tax=Pseudonocardia zijingensis TaxID=153376 RepID=A0ABP3YQL8_9PSEU